MKTYKASSFYSYPGMTVAIVEIPPKDDLPNTDEEIEIDGGRYTLRGFDQMGMMYAIDGTRRSRVHMVVHELASGIKDMRRPEVKKKK